MSWGDKFEWPVKPNEEVKINYISEPTLIELELFVPCEVQGEAVGDLMVYGWRGEWYVAHIPTETRFDKAVPEGDWTKEQLVIWCSKVQTFNVSGWKEMSKYTDETYSDMSDVLKRVIKEHCLSIGVI